MSAPFPSVLVANRGEIACRIFRTARAMGMRSIAVYSDADAKAKHVREADVALHIGPAAASDSYLRGNNILAAAKESGAAAIHPGYGFLSENPEFAEAVVAAGLIWIGPTPASIRAMGLKDEAKRIAIAAGVPVLPGYQGEDQSEKLLLDEAKAIGFPVLIKAVAGGGGRGIREVGAAEDFKDQLASARREAKAAFGDDRVLIEKLVQRPRHIEVQVFGDKHGGLVHLFERDCSLQRRRQKVIEEAPAPGMTDEVRAAMTEAALKVARAVSYENAGTVEFIVDGNGPLRPDGFWFLEMNTRLQVEHPVTEAITGLDLVEWQFRVAAGERLPRKQDQIAIDGHAIEARICAEDPGEDFRPSVGRLVSFAKSTLPLRLDSGFSAGDAVGSHYDNLLAKLIAHADTRYEAIDALKANLRRPCAVGVSTNVSYLTRAISEPDFYFAGVQSGDLETGFLSRRHAALTAPADARAPAAAAALWLGGFLDHDGSADVWAADGWRLNAPPARRCHTVVAGAGQDALVEQVGKEFRVTVAGHTFTCFHFDLGEDMGAPAASTHMVRCERDGWLDIALVRAGGHQFVQSPDGELFEIAHPGAAFDAVDQAAADEIIAPLPGKIVSLVTAPGASVKKGDPLLTLEAMKMEHALKAPRDGVVAEVTVAEGAQVKEGEVLVRLEEARS